MTSRYARIALFVAVVVAVQLATRAAGKAACGWLGARG